MDVSLLIDYDYIGDRFCIGGNVKYERVKSLIGDFLRTQMGAGADGRPNNILDLYEIDIFLDLSNDTFIAPHNCGNKELREGILLRLFERL